MEAQQQPQQQQKSKPGLGAQVGIRAAVFVGIMVLAYYGTYYGNQYYYDKETADGIDWQHPLLIMSAVFALFVALLAPLDQVPIYMLFLVGN